MSGIQYKSKMQPIPLEKFEALTGLNLGQFGFDKWSQVGQIIAPTDLKKIISINAMPIEYLHRLLSKIGTLGAPDNKVYASAKISLGCIDPNLLFLGQKFVYRSNYTAILENFCNLFTDFALPRGFGKLTPFLIIGQDDQNKFALAHYLPPIIEIHQEKLVLLDGVHRSFIAKQSGTNLEGIIIEGVSAPFPCAPKPWNEVSVIDQKPPKIEDRYFDLKVELFRDLKGIGIDG